MHAYASGTARLAAPSPTKSHACQPKRGLAAPVVYMLTPCVRVSAPVFGMHVHNAAATSCGSLERTRLCLR